MADRIRIEVADHGPGIPEDEQGLVFDPFYRADAARSGSARGSGLGLAVARRIVDRLGGHIGVRTPTDGGALFWVDIPCKAVAGTVAGVGRDGAGRHHRGTCEGGA